MSVNADLEFVAGEDVVITETVTPTTDITGWTITFTLKKNAADSTATLTKSGVITSAAGGVFTVTLTAANTATLEPRVYDYDIWRTNAGFESCLTFGRLTLLPRVR